MEGLLIAILASALYAVAISWGMAREFDNRIVTRPIIVAGGIAIVVLAKEWGNWDIVSSWFIWLGVSAIPQVIRVAVIHVNDERRKRLQRAGIQPPGDNDNASSA